MKKYKVDFEQTTFFTAIIEADNDDEAETKFDDGNYQIEGTGHIVDTDMICMEEVKEQ
jgi:hypothetical protein